MVMATSAPNRRRVILAWGNPGRGDDALGPGLMERIRSAKGQDPDLTLVEAIQLQVEHALDLEGHDIALFIDASLDCPPPFTCTPLIPGESLGFSTHSVSPQAILHVYRQLRLGEPPPALLLSIRGVDFRMGQPLSSAGKSHLEAAWSWVQDWLGLD